MLSVTNVFTSKSTINKIPIFNEDGCIMVSFIRAEGDQNNIISFNEIDGSIIITADDPSDAALIYSKMIGDVVMLLFGSYGISDLIYWIDLKTGENGSRSVKNDNALFIRDYIFYYDLDTECIYTWNIREDDVVETIVPDHLKIRTIGDDSYEWIKLTYVNSKLFILLFTYDEAGSSKTLMYDLEGIPAVDSLQDFSDRGDYELYGENPSFCLDGSYFYIPSDGTHLIYSNLDDNEETVDLNIKELLEGEGYCTKEMMIVNTFKDADKTSVWIRVSSKDDDKVHIFMNLSSRMKRAKNARK